MQGFEVIVLAGGLGTRLRSEVPNLPKPMAPVAGKPFIEHLFERLIAQGAGRIVLSIGYLSESIISYFGDSYRGVEIEYVVEQEPLGTGGAIAKALKYCRAENVLVLNGDTFLDMNYLDFLTRSRLSNCRMGIVVRIVQDTARFGRCEISDNRVTKFGEKSGGGIGAINAGVYSVSHNLFDGFELGNKFSFEQDFIAKFLHELTPFGYLVDGYFIDIGVPEDFRRAQIELTSNK